MLKRRARFLFIGPPELTAAACRIVHEMADQWVEARACAPRDHPGEMPDDVCFIDLSAEAVVASDLCVLLDDSHLPEAESLGVPVRRWALVGPGSVDGRLRAEIDGSVAGLKWLARSMALPPAP